MATSRAVPSVRCVACHRRVLEAFSGLRISRTSQRSSRATEPQRQAFNTVTSFRANHPQFPSDSIDDQPVQQEDKPETATRDSTVPWYLQDRDAADHQNPFSYRQRIPEMPDNPPPLLEPLLKQLSVDIGLDYLNLMDLRNVDPPPAFGSNLFMIFGTARSEKHLNVSADRICRWLRSEYKLSPFADGLLGRQELKLKLRRKARRSNMMSAAGGSPLSEFQMDDGTRTGWVCINVGDVKPGEAAEDERQQDDFVGFGKRTDNAKIVIQMMTEEKRVDLDLETLWQGILRGSARRQHAIEQQEIPPERATTLSQPKLGGRRRMLLQPRVSRYQLRSFSSTTAWMRAAAHPDEDTHAYATKEDPTTIDFDRVVDRSTQEGNPSKSSRYNIPELPFEHADGNHASNSDIPRALSYGSLKFEPQDQHLKKMLSELYLLGPKERIAKLGTGWEDRNSTDFLRDWYAKFPPVRTTDHYVAQLNLLRSAHFADHPGYPTQQMIVVLKEMEAACLYIPQPIFLMVAHSILGAHQASTFDRVLVRNYKSDESDAHPEKDLKIWSPIYRSYEKKLHLAFDVLERMEAHGHPRLPLRFFTTLLSMLRHPHSFWGPKTVLTFRERNKLLLQYYHSIRLIFPRDQPLPRLIYLDFLRCCASTGDWKLFWRAWHDTAAEGFHRDATMYAILFEGLSAQLNRDMAWKALREFVPEMAREEPPVQVDRRIALALLRTMRVLGFDPREDFGPRHDQVAPIWERCWSVAGFEPLKKEDVETVSD